MDSGTLRLPQSSGRSSSGEVFASLIEAIATGHLRAGDRLPSEEQLAAHFDVAPMTLRQALARLRELGYVETRRGRGGGTTVTADIAQKLERDALDREVTVDALRILTDWRRAVSGEASLLAALRGTDAERRVLRELEEEYSAVIHSTTERRLADARLHIHVAQMSGNPRLVQAEREIQEQLTRFIRVTAFGGVNLTEADMGHLELVDAIVAGESDAARDALLGHVEVTYLWGSRQPNVSGHTPQSTEDLAAPVVTDDAARLDGLRLRPDAPQGSSF